MIIKLTQVPTESICWDYKIKMCPYFEAGKKYSCRLFDDTLGIDSKQQDSQIGVIGICYWQKEVVV